MFWGQSPFSENRKISYQSMVHLRPFLNTSFPSHKETNKICWILFRTQKKKKKRHNDIVQCPLKSWKVLKAPANLAFPALVLPLFKQIFKIAKKSCQWQLLIKDSFKLYENKPASKMVNCYLCTLNYMRNRKMTELTLLHILRKTVGFGIKGPYWVFLGVLWFCFKKNEFLILDFFFPSSL